MRGSKERRSSSLKSLKTKERRSSSLKRDSTVSTLIKAEIDRALKLEGLVDKQSTSTGASDDSTSTAHSHGSKHSTPATDHSSSTEDSTSTLGRAKAVLDRLTKLVIEKIATKEYVENDSSSSSTQIRQSFVVENRHRIDFILVNKVNDPCERNIESRDLFEIKLRKKGLRVEECFDKLKTLRFIKIHVPWDILTKVAEALRISVPLQNLDTGLSSLGGDDVDFKKCFPDVLDYNKLVLPDLPVYYTAWFSSQRQHIFMIDDQDTFFTPAQRSYMANYILTNTVVSGANSSFNLDLLGIESLLNEGIYLAAFPLHSGDYGDDITDDLANYNLRSCLYHTWARLSTIGRRQPLDHIRLYFGERIAFYFAWLGFYTFMLLPMGIIGFCVQMYGLWLLIIHDNPIDNDVCDKSGVGNFTMCPLCDKCHCWKLYVACQRVYLHFFFDNDMIVLFAVCMAIWTAIFDALWKRQESILRYHWHVHNYKQEEKVRPQYLTNRGRAEKSMFRMLVTYSRKGGSLFVVALMLAIAIGSIFFLIIGRTITFSKNANTDNYLHTELVTAGMFGVINLLLIVVMEYVYVKIASVLTNFENHRTESDWETSYIIKLFLFQFINNNVSLFYVAFIKGHYVGYPPNYNRVFGSRIEHCDLGTCLDDLFVHLAFIMIGKICLKRLISSILRFKTYTLYQKYFTTYKDTQWERDFTLIAVPEKPIIDEYMDMVIQYAHMTMYAAALPLAPTILLCNNILEIKADAFKFTNMWRRPVARRAEGINVWATILNGISKLSFLSNAFIIASTSDFIKKLVYVVYFNTDLHGYVNFTLADFQVSDYPASQPCGHDGLRFDTCKHYGFVENHKPYDFSNDYWIVMAAQFIFVVSFTCLLLVICWFIDYLVTDVPNEVKVHMERENILINKATLDIGDTDMEETPDPRRKSDHGPEPVPVSRPRALSLFE